MSLISLGMASLQMPKTWQALDQPLSFHTPATKQGHTQHFNNHSTVGEAQRGEWWSSDASWVNGGYRFTSGSTLKSQTLLTTHNSELVVSLP